MSIFEAITFVRIAESLDDFRYDELANIFMSAAQLCCTLFLMIAYLMIAFLTTHS